MRARILAGAILSLTLLTTGCGSTPDDGKDADVVKLSFEESEAAMDRFIAFQQEFVDIDTMAARGTVEAQDGSQTVDLSFNREAETFGGEVRLRSGEFDFSIEVIRAKGLLWIKGPPEYWESQGLDGEPAIDKFVVFEIAQGRQLADSYDYQRALAAVENVSTAEVSVNGVIEHDGSDFFRYTVERAAGDTLVDVPVDGTFESLYIVSAVEDVEAVIRFSDFGEPVEISPPPAAKVVQP